MEETNNKHVLKHKIIISVLYTKNRNIMLKILREMGEITN